MTIMNNKIDDFDDWDDPQPTPQTACDRVAQVIFKTAEIRDRCDKMMFKINGIIDGNKDQDLDSAMSNKTSTTATAEKTHPINEVRRIPCYVDEGLAKKIPYLREILMTEPLEDHIRSPIMKFLANYEALQDRERDLMNDRNEIIVGLRNDLKKGTKDKCEECSFQRMQHLLQEGEQLADPDLIASIEHNFDRLEQLGKVQNHMKKQETVMSKLNSCVIKVRENYHKLNEQLDEEAAQKAKKCPVLTVNEMIEDLEKGQYESLSQADRILKLSNGLLDLDNLRKYLYVKEKTEVKDLDNTLKEKEELLAFMKKTIAAFNKAIQKSPATNILTDWCLGIMNQMVQMEKLIKHVLAESEQEATTLMQEMKEWEHEPTDSLQLISGLVTALENDDFKKTTIIDWMMSDPTASDENSGKKLLPAIGTVKGLFTSMQETVAQAKHDLRLNTSSAPDIKKFNALGSINQLKVVPSGQQEQLEGYIKTFSTMYSGLCDLMIETVKYRLAIATFYSRFTQLKLIGWFEAEMIRFNFLNSSTSDQIKTKFLGKQDNQDLNSKRWNILQGIIKQEDFLNF